MKKTLYRIHPGISGDAVQSFFAIGRQEILPDLLWQKNVNPAFVQQKCPEPESNQRHEDFQSSALPTELSGHFDFLLETFVNITWIRENCNCFIENLEKNCAFGGMAVYFRSRMW